MLACKFWSTISLLSFLRFWWPAACLLGKTFPLARTFDFPPHPILWSATWIPYNCFLAMGKRWWSNLWAGDFRFLKVEMLCCVQCWSFRTFHQCKVGGKWKYFWCRQTVQNIRWRSFDILLSVAVLYNCIFLPPHSSYLWDL